MPKTKCTPDEVYDKIIAKFFRGELVPGQKLVEQNLADELGVSRVPVRETLNRLVAQGVLTAVGKRSSIRVRLYTPEQVQQLYQYREMIEGGVARYAAANASAAEIVKMEMINTKMAAEIGNFGSALWAELDYTFHVSLAEASRNERFTGALKTLLRECYYVFYLRPDRQKSSKLSDKEIKQHMKRVLADHTELLDLIKKRDGEKAEQKAREVMRETGDRAFREMIDYHLDTAGGTEA